MSEGERYFVPEPARLGREAIYGAVGLAVVGPAMLWWNEVPWAWGAVILPVAFVFVLGQDVYKARVRGRDMVYLATEGIRVTNRRRVWTMAWREIHRAHLFKDQLIFETVAPHRRETLSLEGHDAHRAELQRAIAERARTLNLRWFDTISNALG